MRFLRRLNQPEFKGRLTLSFTRLLAVLVAPDILHCEDYQLAKCYSPAYGRRMFIFPQVVHPDK